MARLNEKLIFWSIFLLFFTSFTYAAYPAFEFLPQNFPAGQVDIGGKASSGSQVELFINDLTLGTVDVIANETLVILDGNSIQNQVLPYGSTIKFRNEAPRNYQINISGTYKELAYGDELTYVGNVIGDVSYSDNVEGINRVISVVDSLVDFKFEYVNDYLENGDNDLKFLQKFPYLDYSNQSVFEYNINFEKYINDITITNSTNITNQHSTYIEGYVESVSYPIYYTLNIKPSELANLGALNELTLTGDRFNFSVDNLQEGENNVYVITTDPNNQNIFTGVQRVQIFVDTIPPVLDIKKVTFEKSGNTYRVDFGSNVYINGNRLTLEIETDAVFINYTFNNETYTQDEIINGSVNLTLNLDDGLNPLVLIPVDIAGNIIKESHNIYFDDKEPDIIRESLKPENMFKENVARFFFEEIEGKTNKGDVSLTIFTLPYNAETMDGKDVDCKDYEDLFIRNLGQMDRERVDGPELNLNESQVSLTNYMFQKTTVKSDSDGEFEALIGLQEKEFSRKEYNNVKNNRSEDTQSVASKNRICFVMSDKYGNFNIHEESVTLDAGNTMWRPGEITTIPNTIYASEIENAGDQRNSGDNVEFSVIAQFQYIGAGKVNSLTSFTIKEDTETSEHSKYVSIDPSRRKYSLDTETGELTAYFVVEVAPMGIKPLDYPDALNLAFEVRPVYTVGETNIPIDTQNPIYFQTTVNIESPLDHTKWLTPEMIESTLKFLNQSIAFTEQAIEWTGLGSVVGVLACTGSKFYYAARVAMLDKEKDKAEIDKLKHDMFMICDRVMCSSSPNPCEEQLNNEMFDEGKSGVISVDKDKSKKFAQEGKSLSLNKNELMDQGKVYSTDDENNKVLAKFNGLNCRGICDYHGTEGPNDGILCSGDVTQFKDVGGKWISSMQTGTQYIENQCVPASFTKDEKGEITGLNAINVQEASSVCFQEGAPHFDETRCPTLGYGEPLKGWNPADNIIESVACGCITDTYSHLKNYLKIQQAIRGCLEQAKIGETKGSYCERLMGQAVCDIATNVLFKTAGQFADRTNAGGKNPRDNPILAALGGLQEGDKVLNDRYSDSFYTKAGLGTEQIVNKVCLGAITGDWSLLTENILSAVDQNEVEPIFGPMLPESRLQGYDPYTGAMSIRYTFTYAAVSGGQRIDSKVEFICDSSKPGGDYCPDGGSYSSDQLSSGLNIPGLSVSDGASKQETIVITDKEARYRYNIVRITHSYELKGERMTKVSEENIFQKGETMLANCYFTGGVAGAGGGFNCETLFDNDALASAFSIDKSKTKLIPTTKKTYYPKESVYLKLGYTSNYDQDNQQTKFDLAYKALCPSATDGGKALQLGVVPITVGQDNYGTQVVELFEIPTVGQKVEDEYITYRINVDDLKIETDEEYKIQYINKLEENSVEFTVEGFDKNSRYNFVGNSCVGRKLLGAGKDFSCDLKIVKSDSSKSNSDDSLIIKVKDTDRDKLAIKLLKSDGKTEVVTFTPNQITGGTTKTEFDTIGPGQCEVTIKLLGNGQGNDAIGSIEAFDKANVLGEDIIASKNIDTQAAYKLSFLVAKEFDQNVKPEQKDKETHIEFYNPDDGAGICLDDEDKGEIEFDYVAQTQSDKDLYLQITWSLENFAIKDDFGYEIIDWLPTWGPNTIDLNENALKALNDLGMASPINLKYIVSAEEDDIENGEPSITPIKEGRIQFNLEVREGTGCSSKSAYDYKSVDDKKPEDEANPSAEVKKDEVGDDVK